MSKIGISANPLLYNPWQKSTGKHAPVLEWAKAHERETVALIRQMVERESPSDEPGALEAFADWFSANGERDFGAHVETARGRAPAVPISRWAMRAPSRCWCWAITIRFGPPAR